MENNDNPDFKGPKIENGAEYVCSQCSKVYPRHITLKQHVIKCHPTDSALISSFKVNKECNFKSDDCGKNLKNSAKFVCPQCSKVYSHRRTLKQHVIKRHPNDSILIASLKVNKVYNFKCDDCGKNFNKIKHLNFHKRQKHAATGSILISSLKVGKEYNFKSDDCGKNVENSAKFVCPQCSKVFSRHKTLKQHVIKYHPVESALISSLKVNKVHNPKSDDSNRNLKNNAKFVCSRCSKVYSHHRTLKQHVIKSHPTDSVLIASLKENKVYNFKCDDCGNNFNKIKHLNFHKRQKHAAAEYMIHKMFVKCSLCDNEVKKKDYILHCQITHEIKVNSEKLIFSTADDFYQWKENMEMTTKSKYVLQRGVDINKSGSLRRYFHCHRSGHYISRSKGLRHLKIQGSSKINSYCPSTIHVTITKDGVHHVNFIKTHVGHLNDIDHLQLSSKDRDMIASKIAAKIPFDSILNEIRSSLSESDLQRIHFITKKDLYNIVNTFNLNDTAVHH